MNMNWALTRARKCDGHQERELGESMAQLLPLRGSSLTRAERQRNDNPLQAGGKESPGFACLWWQAGNLYTLLVVAICCHNLGHYLT